MTALQHSGSQQKIEFHSDLSGKEILTKGHLTEIWAWLMESTRNVEAHRGQRWQEAIITFMHEGRRRRNSNMELCETWNLRGRPLGRNFNPGGILILQEMWCQSREVVKKRFLSLFPPAVQFHLFWWVFHTLT